MPQKKVFYALSIICIIIFLIFIESVRLPHMTFVKLSIL